VSAAAIVLAAGASSRMGSPKPLLACRGGTFLGSLLSTLGQVEGVAARIAVLGHQAAQVRRGVDLAGARAVTCRGWRGGMLSSLRCGLRAALAQDHALEAALICHVDQPALWPSTPARLLSAFRAGRGDVLVATHAGRCGHPVLLARPFIDRLLSARRSWTLAEAIAALAHRRSEVACPDPAVTQNVNTVEALERFRRSQLNVHNPC
jgi:CTP:molybdopterin cytidylyltransferase MocA